YGAPSAAVVARRSAGTEHRLRGTSPSNSEVRGRKHMRSRRWIFASLAVVLIGGASAQAEPVRIRMAWVAPVSNWPSITLEKKDLEKNHGKTFPMEAVRFAGTPPMITALANDELEVSNLAYSTLGIAIQNAGLTDLRVIADEFQDGVDDYQTTAFFVLADGP